MKILEMIQDGKITAEDAVKLLDALGDTAEEPQGEDRQRRRNESRQRQRRNGSRQRQRQRRHRRSEVQESIREARETLREAMPNVNRIVREATRSIPDVAEIVQDAMKTASEAVSQWVEDSDRKHPKKLFVNRLKQRRSRSLIVYLCGRQEAMLAQKFGIAMRFRLTQKSRFGELMKKR